LKRVNRVVVAIAAASLISSVAIAPAANAKTKQKVCVALDTAGINDKSFNQTSYDGAKRALKLASHHQLSTYQQSQMLTMRQILKSF